MLYVGRMIIQKYVHLVTYVINQSYLFTACTVWKAWHPGSATKALACKRVSSGSQREKICTLTNQRNKAGERTKLQEIHNFVQLLWFWRHFWEVSKFMSHLPPNPHMSEFCDVRQIRTRSIHTHQFDVGSHVGQDQDRDFRLLCNVKIVRQVPKVIWSWRQGSLLGGYINLMKKEWFWVLTL